LTATTGENFNVPTVEAYFSSWLEAKRATGKAFGTLKRYKPVLTASLRLCQSDAAIHFFPRLPRLKPNNSATPRQNPARVRSR